MTQKKKGTQSLGVGCPKRLGWKEAGGGDGEIHDERCFYTGSVQMCKIHLFFFMIFFFFRPFFFLFTLVFFFFFGLVAS